MDEHGIAWMIAGGVRAETAEDQRQRLHRIALAESRPPRTAALLGLRQRITTMVGGRSDRLADTGTLSADCCPA